MAPACRPRSNRLTLPQDRRVEAAHIQDATDDYLVNARHADNVLTVKATSSTYWRPSPPTFPALSQVAQGTPSSRPPATNGSPAKTDVPARQVFRIRCYHYDLAGNRLAKDAVQVITSLDATWASAAQPLPLVHDQSFTRPIPLRRRQITTSPKAPLPTAARSCQSSLADFSLSNQS